MPTHNVLYENSLIQDFFKKRFSNTQQGKKVGRHYS